MTIGSVFTNNRSQAVRLPAEARFPVTVRVVGKERVLAPVENTWDSFFDQERLPGDDFLNERAAQYQAERESFE
ncbi:TPA: AbrB/MazE/SpoVT family DNA-binding domain-containing protein [Serratia rubidaea]|nr:AbrB/MazE/SpoVT family DNA-binding domain-containing protein [Serratia rubidaea]HDJ1448483.1 AbrB/MazE/SpoVT family DNA-binding domain-containing protein [Serratia rubidaea]HDJ1463940.1 AbrB/MazE/SpoVT family DNA-binding domain-containing protein [Serratia rubidaea]HDJ2772169.1 AbrB/MazE/SpoVT family DNA-binding domain-containing protein [Serratia rubidaea]